MIIKDSYSALNNYNYANKSSFISSLDWLSTPCRRVLGGRNVCVISQTYENKMPTAMKVVVVFFSVLIFPVAIVSIASLIIKFATFPFIWEKKIVQIQSQGIWDVINQFNQACLNKNYDQAILSLKQNPELGKRKEVTDNLFKIINLKINQSAPWSEIQTLLPYLNTSEAIQLINYAVKEKLSNQLKNNCYDLTGADIKLFIGNSLNFYNIKNIEESIKTLVSGALQVTANEDIIHSAIKMDLADQLIRTLTEMKISNGKNEFESLQAKLLETSLRGSVFQNNKLLMTYYSIFHSADIMQKTSTSIQNIRTANQKGTESLKKLEALLKENSNQQSKLESCGLEITKFQKYVNSLESSSGEAEKEFIQLLQNHLTSTLKLIEFKNQANPAVEEVKTFDKKLESLKEQTNNLKSLLNSKILSFKTFDEQFLLTLELKVKEELSVLSTKMITLVGDKF